MLFVCALHQCSPFYTFHRLELNAVALMVRMPIRQKNPANKQKLIYWDLLNTVMGIEFL